MEWTKEWVAVELETGGTPLPTKGRSTRHGGPIEACHGCFDARYVGLTYMLHTRDKSEATIDCSVLPQGTKVDIRLKANIAFL